MHTCALHVFMAAVQHVIMFLSLTDHLELQNAASPRPASLLLILFCNSFLAIISPLIFLS